MCNGPKTFKKLAKAEMINLNNGFVLFRYPMLQDDPVYRPATAELFSRTQAHIATRQTFDHLVYPICVFNYEETVRGLCVP